MTSFAELRKKAASRKGRDQKRMLQRIILTPLTPVEVAAVNKETMMRNRRSETDSEIRRRWLQQCGQVFRSARFNNLWNRITEAAAPLSSA